MTIEIVPASEELRRVVFGRDYMPIFPGSEDMLRIIWIADMVSQSSFDSVGEMTQREESLPPNVYHVKLRLWMSDSAYATEKLYASVDLNANRVTWLGEYERSQPRPLTRREQRQHASFVRATIPRRRPWRLHKKVHARFGARHYAGTAAARTFMLRQHPPRLHEAVDALLLQLVREKRDESP